MFCLGFSARNPSEMFCYSFKLVRLTLNLRLANEWFPISLVINLQVVPFHYLPENASRVRLLSMVHIQLFRLLIPIIMFGHLGSKGDRKGSTSNR